MGAVILIINTEVTSMLILIIINTEVTSSTQLGAVILFPNQKHTSECTLESESSLSDDTVVMTINLKRAGKLLKS